jgi:2-hydroxychromene-2-carboxylate isomerase
VHQQLLKKPMTAIQFYFEFASPYSYIASLEIEEVATRAGRTVDWLPIELPVVWATHGVLEAYAAIRQLKRPYIARDAARCARLRGVALTAPSESARDASTAKLAHWGLRDQDPRLAKQFLQAVWHRYFNQAKSINGLNDLAEASGGIGLDVNSIRAAADWEGARRAQDECNAAAAASGCFGVPWFVADGEAFFGHDRLTHLATHLNARQS